MGKIRFIRYENGIRKYNKYPIGKIEFVYDEDTMIMSILLVNFVNDKGELLGYDNYNIATLRLNFDANDLFEERFIDCLKIKISDFYVNNIKDNSRCGFASSLWLSFVKYGLLWYFNFYNIKNIDKIVCCGWLSPTDYADGNWILSFPFYISLGDKINNQKSSISCIQTIFGYNSDIVSPIQLIEVYNSCNELHIKEYNSIGRDEYCKQIMSNLISSNRKCYIIFVFSY